LEPLVVLEKLEPPRCVFVVEPEPLLASLAMRLYDYGPAIRDGRLVFWIGDLSRAVRVFFEANPGYTMPQTLVVAPQRSASEIAGLREQLEQVSAVAVEIQNRVWESARLGISRTPLASKGRTPRLAVVSWDARPGALELAGRIRCGADQLGWSCKVCVPDSPRNDHAAVALRLIDEQKADLVLVVNHPPSGFVEGLGGHRPIALWFDCDSTVRPPPSPDRNVIACATSRRFRSGLESSGWPVERILCTPPAVDDALVAAARPALPPSGRTTAVFMTLPRAEPEALGITLPSHRVLWLALHRQALAGHERIDDPVIGQWLERAQDESGTTLRDEAMLERFREMTRAVLIPIALAHQAAMAASAAGCSVRLWGAPVAPKEGWPPFETMPACADFLGEASNIQILILPLITAEALRRGLEALAAGAIVVCRSSREELHSDFPGIEIVTPYLHVYQTRGELAALLSHRARDDSLGSVEHRRVVREKIARHLTVSCRLREIVEVFTRRNAPCGPS
jgi:hypothetical protein